MKKWLWILTLLIVAACTPNGPGFEAFVTPNAEPETSSDTAPTTNLPAQEGADQLDHVNLLGRLVIGVRSEAEASEILDQIDSSRDTRFIAGLIDALRYQRGYNYLINPVLQNLTQDDETHSLIDWHDWVEWAGKHPEIETFEDYGRWKSSLFSLIDPNFNRFVYPGVAVAEGSRLEEIVWGGVRVDGIPALDNPTMISPEEADYLQPQERVFGVSINGDTRAYPARFLDWHEMFNDVVGDEAVSLAY